MQALIGRTVISLRQGDITTESVDAIVNAANSTLLGGGGVDGAIHRAGGPAILEECKQIAAAQGGCPTGQAVITTAGMLPARFVIHTVGPIWGGGGHGEVELLRSAYRTSLMLAEQNGLRTVAFPSISTGAYRFPIVRAATLALGTIAEHCRTYPDAHDEIAMVLFTDIDLEVYQDALEALVHPASEPLSDDEAEPAVESTSESPAQSSVEGVQQSLFDDASLDESE